MPPTPRGLVNPSAIALTRASDRVSFLYLDRCAISQDDNGTIATTTAPDGSTVTTRIPTAIIAALILGPGTSITQAALAAAARNGCAITFTGSTGTRHYATFLPPNSSTRLLTQQARISSNPELRIEAAITLYKKRFPEPLTALAGTNPTLEQLRGLEGAHIKAIYAREAKHAKLRNWRRHNGHNTPDTQLDPVNETLNHLNTALYGITHAIVHLLGLSPGLGIIHEGNRQAFTLDIADIYKPSTSIPLAFAVRNHANPPAEALRRLRESITLIKLIPKIVHDIHDTLNTPLDTGPDDWDIDTLNLWGPQHNTPAGNNHAPDWITPHIHDHRNT